MRISAKSEYACIAMLEMAVGYRHAQPLRVKDICDAQGVPGRFLVQILQQLKTASLVTSVRGAAGGYQLMRPPDKITLAEIINAVNDPSLTAREAADVSSASPVAETLMEVWRVIRAEEQRLLKSITLAELVRRSEQRDALSYQI